jgi:mRNA interferase MazF
LEFLESVTVAPITSTIRDVPSEVRLAPEDGMRAACAVNLHHVHSVPRAKLGALITTLSAERMDQVRDALLFALGFD